MNNYTVAKSYWPSVIWKKWIFRFC